MLMRIGSGSEHSAKAVTGHLQYSFNHASTGSNQYQEYLYRNQDGHGVPGVLNDCEDDAAENDQHQTAQDDRRKVDPDMHQKAQKAEDEYHRQ